MQLRVFAILGLLLAAPVMARANTISVQGSSNVLQPGLAGQTVTLLISGGDAYSDGNLRTQISAGGPAIEAVFGDNLTGIPVANLASSVWVNGFGGIAGTPNGTTLDSSGRALEVSFGTAGFGSVTTSGIYAVFTVTTVGVNPGNYTLSFDGTDLFNGLDEFGDPIPAPLTLAPITLTVVPEPSSIVMGLMAAAGMAAVVIRRRRAA